MVSLWDIEALRPLERVGRRHGVSFILRGGAAFRAALAMAHATPARSVDLFDLTPFTADVDLLHSGDTGATLRILDDILWSVPNAECLRWELRSAREFSAVIGQPGNLVPARLVELTGAIPDGWRDPAGGLRDIAARRFRYARSPLFRQSPLHRAGRDIEAFSALLYLQTLAEACIPADAQAAQPGWVEVSAVFADVLSDVSLAPMLQQHAYLRGRVRHLLTSLVTSHAGVDEFLTVSSSCGLSGWLKNLHIAVPGLFGSTALRSRLGIESAPQPTLDENATLVASDRLVGDLHRIEVFGGRWGLPADVAQLPMLDAGQDAVLVSPVLVVHPGASLGPIVSTPGAQPSPTIPAAVATGRARSPEQEFIHIEVPAIEFKHPAVVDAIAGVSEERIGAFLLLMDDEGAMKSLPLALPAIVQWRPKQGVRRLGIRMNCLGVLSRLPRKTSAHVVVVAARPDP